ncbi:Y+L amino acid transporter 2-like isoform X2 [Halichondria panicea]|uniref:Y+L amino acid transporter 2-like isoform X2 n=1 Tax=Halichondria panicea TaxID=6063 RepID=UPI00312B9953
MWPILAINVACVFLLNKSWIKAESYRYSTIMEQSGVLSSNIEGEVKESKHGTHEHPKRIGKPTVTLRKELGIVSGVGLIFGNVIGSGIFITTSSILGYTQSFGLTLIAWVVGGLIALIGSLCYCELGTMIQKSGSEYAYILEAYSFRRKNKYLRTVGEMLAFTNVWYDFLVGNPASLAIPLLTFGNYLCRPFFIGCPELPVLPVKLIALAALIMSTLVNIYSVKWANRVSNWLSFLKFISLAFIVVLGIYHIIANRCFSSDASSPFNGATKDISSIALALYGVMYAYDGWDALNMMQEEVKDIERVLPRAILIAIPLVVLSYVAVNVAFFAVLSYEEIESSEAVGLVFANAVIGNAGLIIVPFMVALATFSSAHVSLLSQSRKLFVSSRDGIMPECLAGVHITHRTPIPAVLCVVL